MLVLSFLAEIELRFGIETHVTVDVIEDFIVH